MSASQNASLVPIEGTPTVKEILFPALSSTLGLVPDRTCANARTDKRKNSTTTTPIVLVICPHP
jgi:hypothetical protein